MQGEETAVIENIPNTEYKKENITFVIKNLPFKESDRWAKWAEKWGLSNHHHTAFRLALELLEGKTENIIDLGSRLTTIENQLKNHNSILKQINENNDMQPEEEPDANQEARDWAAKRKLKKQEKEKTEDKKDV